MRLSPDWRRFEELARARREREVQWRAEDAEWPKISGNGGASTNGKALMHAAIINHWPTRRLEGGEEIDETTTTRRSFSSVSEATSDDLLDEFGDFGMAPAAAPAGVQQKLPTRQAENER